MSITEIMFFWESMYKYDHILHGFEFEEKQMTSEGAKKKVDDLTKLYGDLNG